MNCLEELIKWKSHWDYVADELISAATTGSYEDARGHIPHLIDIDNDALVIIGECEYFGITE